MVGVGGVGTSLLLPPAGSLPAMGSVSTIRSAASLPPPAAPEPEPEPQPEPEPEPEHQADGLGAEPELAALVAAHHAAAQTHGAEHPTALAAAVSLIQRSTAQATAELQLGNFGLAAGKVGVAAAAVGSAPEALAHHSPAVLNLQASLCCRAGASQKELRRAVR